MWQPWISLCYAWLREFFSSNRTICASVAPDITCSLVGNYQGNCSYFCSRFCKQNHMLERLSSRSHSVGGHRTLRIKHDRLAMCFCLHFIATKVTAVTLVVPYQWCWKRNSASSMEKRTWLVCHIEAYLIKHIITSIDTKCSKMNWSTTLYWH